MATAKEDLEDLITCEICLNRFTDPRFLPSCCHAFCLKCIQGIHLTASNNPNNKLKDNEFRCPKCQAVSVLPGNSTDNLPKFFHAGNLSDIVEGLTKKHNVCGVCNEGHQKITRYCFTCTKVLCKSCHTHKKYNSHVCVEVTGGNFQVVICGTHNKLIESYCTRCCVGVCIQCISDTHEDHDIHDFVHQQEPKYDPVSAKEAAFKQQQSKIENMQRDFNAHINALHGTITSHTDKLIAQITDQDKALHAELDRHREATNRELEKMKKNLADYDDMIVLAKAQTAQLTRPVPELPTLGLRNVHQLLAAIKRNIPKLKHELPDCTRYEFISQSSSINVGMVIEARSAQVKTQDQTSNSAMRSSGRRHHKLYDEETTRIVLDNPDEQELISRLSSEQVAQILSLETKYQIRVDVQQKSRLHRIRFEGNAKDVASCSAEVTRILHSVQREKQAEQHAKQITEFVKWEYADGHFTPYPDAITVFIEKAHSSKLPQVEWEEEEGVYRIIFADMVEKAYGKYGRGPAKTIIPVRRKLLTAGGEDGGLPENWEDMKKGEPFTLVQLSPVDLEYTDVECTFRKTSQTLNSIVKIERVQNPYLYHQYSVKKRHMEAANPAGHLNERTLYHGTSADTLQSINTTGFNRSYCGKKFVVIGKGVGFTRDAMYSAQNTYSPPDANGHKHVYQSKVLTGEFTRGTCGLLAPPAKDPNVPHILYDSVVDLPTNPSIFVIFNDTLAYPEYLITFT